MTKPMAVHLRVRTAFAVGRGYLRAPDLVRLARDGNIAALGIADPDTMYDMITLPRDLAAGGVQPIPGCELMLDGPVPGRLLFLVPNETGWRCLLHLVERAHRRAFETRGPARIIPADLADAQDLFCLDGRPDSPTGALLAQKGDHAPRLAGHTELLLDRFGDRYLIEIGRHDEPDERRLEPLLLDLAARRGIAPVGTTDVHFGAPDDYDTHRAIFASTAGKLLDDPDAPKLSRNHRLAPATALHHAFRDIPEAVDNAIAVARRCTWWPRPSKQYRMPVFLDCPAEERAAREDAQIRADAAHGLATRLKAVAADPAPYHQRLDYELGVISRMGFSGYFLIVADFIGWAHRNGIPVGPGRGSGAGSIVAWALGITALDPIQHQLLFERFLNPDRISMPDFDVDFADAHRSRVVDYLRQRYGADRVAAIMTVNARKARQTVTDAAGLVGLPYTAVEKYTALLPSGQGAGTLAETVSQNPDVKAAFDRDPTSSRLLQLALRMEGAFRHVSTHASGIVVADCPLADIVPVTYDFKTGIPVVQYPMEVVEKAGLIKFDILALATLTVTEETIALEAETGRTIDLDQLPPDDPETFALLARADTHNVFQLESDGMREYLARLKPTCFDDVVAMVALYRPGPMRNIPDYIARKHGQQAVRVLHPRMKPVVDSTYGVLIYQEQIIELAKQLAGYTPGRADNLRRGVGKKKREDVEAEKPGFIAGCVEQGIPEHTALSIFDLIEKFASYGFNRSHAAAYALVAYRTAWLKTHARAAFCCANLNNEIDDQAKLISIYADNVGQPGLAFAPPCLTRPSARFRLERGAAGEPDTIRFGLAAIKSIGLAAALQLEQHGPCRTLDDVGRACDAAKLSRDKVELLVGAGAVRAIEPEPAKALAHLHAQGWRINTNQGMLFSLAEVTKPPDTEPWTDIRRSKTELEALGTNLVEAPCEGAFLKTRRAGVATVEEVTAEVRGRAPPAHSTIGGILIKVERTPTGIDATLIDDTGTAILSIGAEKASRYADLAEKGSCLIAAGKPALAGGRLTIAVSEILTVDVEPLVVQIDLEDDADLRDIRLLLDRHPVEPHTRPATILVTLPALPGALFAIAEPLGWTRIIGEDLSGRFPDRVHVLGTPALEDLLVTPATVPVSDQAELGSLQRLVADNAPGPTGPVAHVYLDLGADGLADTASRIAWTAQTKAALGHDPLDSAPS